MRALLLVCLWSFVGGETIEKEFDFGDGQTLTLGFSPDLMRNPDWGLKDDFIDHDCNTIRDFDSSTPYSSEAEEWIYRYRRNWNTEKYFQLVKYNHAYGIPVLGMPWFTDDSMRRACYLVRFLFADNEWFRRYARASTMVVKGAWGGISPPAQAGNQGQSCPCGHDKPVPRRKNKDGTLKKLEKNHFPSLSIFATAHEMGHVYIAYVLTEMEKAGRLTVPKFINSTVWNWTQPYNAPFGDKNKWCGRTESSSKREGKVHDFIWNALQQDSLKGTTKIDRCQNEHFFIYTGQDKFLGFPSGGEPKKKKRKYLKENNTNLWNLLEKIWPCNNNYLSVCEDSAYGMTKGLTEKLRIGKHDPDSPADMVCKDDIDKPEIDEDEMQKLSPVPTEDVSIPKYVDWNKEKCLKVAREGEFLTSKQKLGDLEEGQVAKSLVDSNEYGWWLRKCCAKSAKFPISKLTN